MLFNEPKLLKFTFRNSLADTAYSFSALQRAEIAEINIYKTKVYQPFSFSALQRAEIAEIGAGTPGLRLK